MSMAWVGIGSAVLGAGASIYGSKQADKRAEDAAEAQAGQNNIPGFMQPAMSEYYGGLEGNSFMRQYDPEYYGGQTYADVPSYYQNAMQDYAASGSDPNSATGQSQQYNQDTLAGDYLGMSDPMMNAVMNPAMDATASRFAQMGRYGSPASQSSMMQSGMEAMMPYYNAERGRQDNAASNLPIFDDMAFERFGPLATSDRNQQQLGISEDMSRHDFGQNSYYDRMSAFGNLLGVGSGYSNLAQPIQPKGDALSAGLGGALAGYSAVSGWGSGFGGGGGSTAPTSSYLGNTSASDTSWMQNANLTGAANNYGGWG